MSQEKVDLYLERLRKASSFLSKSKSVKHCIDTPLPDQAISSPFVELAGWIAAKKSANIENLTLVNSSGAKQRIRSVERPDVQALYPRDVVSGFADIVSLTDFVADDNWRLNYTVDQETHSFPVPVSMSSSLHDILEEYRSNNASKLRRIRKILRCADCGNSDLIELEDGLACRCGSRVESNGRSFRFSVPEATEKTTGSNVSSHDYDSIACEFIEQFPDGLILDNGAGFRREYYPNVVNFEIADYPSTDVVGVGEKLPFASESFDAVFSLSVLEHVKQPFECAQEIARVLKPGGVLYAVVPFLQPFHGYPDHYYNMTASGLESLFDPHLEIVDLGVPKSGLPIWCLSWFLRSYLEGLPEQAARRFKEMRVSELIAEPLDYFKEDFVSALGEWTTQELAASNYLLARK